MEGWWGHLKAVQLVVEGRLQPKQRLLLLTQLLKPAQHGPSLVHRLLRAVGATLSDDVTADLRKSRPCWKRLAAFPSGAGCRVVLRGAAAQQPSEGYEFPSDILAPNGQDS
jgi:hypothetical protein